MYQSSLQSSSQFSCGLLTGQIESEVNMYSNIKHLGVTLAEWQAVFGNQYSLGELYQMHVGNSPWPIYKMEALRARDARLGNS